MEGKIYLNGGAEVMNNETLEVDKKIFNEAEIKKILILNLTSENKEMNEKYRIFLEKYFKEIGYEESLFASEIDSEKIKERFDEFGVIYLPGGDNELLMKNLEEKDLVSKIKSFKGIIIGNSAGTMVLCEYAICGYEEEDLVKGFGLVNLNIAVHYSEKDTSKLQKLSQQKEIYALPEKSLIVLKEKEKQFINEVYLFSKGERSKVN